MGRAPTDATRPAHEPDALEDGTPEGRRPWRRRLLAGVALAAACALVWSLSSAVVDGSFSNPHGGEVRELDAGAIAGDVEGVADLHGHLNYAIWGDGRLDREGFLATAERTRELADDAMVALLVEDAAASVRGGELRTAHDQVQRAEDQLADLRR